MLTFWVLDECMHFVMGGRLSRKGPVTAVFLDSAQRFYALVTGCGDADPSSPLPRAFAPLPPCQRGIQPWLFSDRRN